MTNYLRLYFSCTFLLLLSSCNKEAAPGEKPPAVFDSSEHAKPITVAEKEHRIYIRPKAGNIFRFRIMQKSSSSANTTGPITRSESASGEDTYYIKQTIRAVRADSTIDMTFRFDSISIKLQKDTMKIDLSSARSADRKDVRFASYNALLEQDIGIILTRFGDIKEVYGTSNIVEKIMRQYPDSMRTSSNSDVMKKQVEATIAEYVHQILMHYSDHPYGKDSTEMAALEQNVPVANVVYPMQIVLKQVLAGFEERAGKTLAVFLVTTTLRPAKAVIENGPVKSTLDNYSSMAKEDIRVDDETGVLIMRKITDEQSFKLMLESKEEAGKALVTEQKTKSVRTVELLR